MSKSIIGFAAISLLLKTTFGVRLYPVIQQKLAVRNFRMQDLDTFTIIILAFGAGMVTHRVLWSFFDWVLDKLEDMDER